jgi:uncharacterized protein
MQSIRAACLFIAFALASLPRLDGADAKADAAKHTNRLAKESSPYLLLHAHNPVDWYPWGDEALAKARAEKKLIFLSVGYASCYWCHVMERESFLDEEIAAALNKNFVCIKVDREERPDIDEVYMQALQVYLRLIGSKSGGGWPLSMFLTPDAKPLMGGTYFPPRDKEGRMGFLTVIARVEQAWNSDRDKWQKTGDSLAEYVAESLRQRPLLRVVKLEPALVDGVLLGLGKQFDATYGGFSFDPNNPQRPKFPEAPNLVFLADYARRNPGDTSRRMLNTTLEKIARGGIRDHVGGGFHRYSTDRYWRVPHFEKMLYDNGQLASVYSQAYELAPREEYRRAVDEGLTFVLREMTDKDGGFYSAIDAETNAKEGRYYVWDRQEVQAALTPDEFALWSGVYGISGQPNFEGHWIPLLSRSLAEEAKARKQDEAVLADQLKAINAKLLAVRSKRPRPLVDTKILTGWNGLMIRGLADAGRVFKNDAHNQAAARAADFVLTHMKDPQGRLLRSYAGGQAKVLAYLDDYAFLIDGLIALARATGDDRWLKAAGELTDRQLALFWDEQVGGFFYTSSEHEVLITRSKLPVDAATPSPAAVAATNLVYLAKALDKPEYLERAQKCLRSVSPILAENPEAVPQSGVALAAWLEATQAAKPAAAAEPAAKP